MGRGDPHRYRRHKGIIISSLRFEVAGLEPETLNMKQGIMLTYLKKDTSIILRRKILDAHNRKLTGN